MSDLISEIVVGVLRKEPYLGAMLQCLDIRLSKQIPTAGVTFTNNKFRALINPDFMSAMTLKQKIAIMLHECYHIINGHLGTIYSQLVNKQIVNIAMDLVNNQHIEDLPEGAMFVENFRDKKGNIFPKGKSTFDYYALLTDNAEMKISKDMADKLDEETKKKVKTDKFGNTWVPIPAKHEFDDHSWNDESEAFDSDKRQRAVEELMRRSKEKMSMNGHSQMSQNLREILETMETQRAELDYKALLNKTMRRSLPSHDRQGTWKRPNRRHGYLAQGSKVSDDPKIYFYVDTSGSISVREANEALRVVEQFLKHGTDRCKLQLFHHDLYYSKEYSKKKKLVEEDFESGGTDLQPVIDHIVKNNPDLAIIITDGYYGEVTQRKLGIKTLFLISAGGTTEHPLKGLGETFKIRSSK